MAPAPITQALTSLLPTTSPLPPDLLSLSSSLFAQSKSLAPNLKTGEEVGRIYAVCQIAAERLRGKHGYEIAKASPPVKPRVYGKLKGFLEGVLAGRPGTPGGRKKAGDGTPGSGRAGRVGAGAGVERKTPESRPTSLRKRWAEARKPRRDETEQEKRVDELEVPRYSMPMIKHLCKVCDAPKAAPHVFTGVSVVLKEQVPARHGREEDVAGSGKKRKRGVEGDGEKKGLGEDDVPGVVLAVFDAVVTRMYGTEKLEDDAHLEAAKKCAEDEKMGLPAVAIKEDYFERAIERFGQDDVERPGRWLEMEWFGNIPEAEDEPQGNGDDADEEMQDATPVRKRPAKTPLRRQEKHATFDADGEGYVGRAGLLPGLGTMFQPAVDWLSDERCLEYRRWEKGIREEFALVEGRA